MRGFFIKEHEYTFTDLNKWRLVLVDYREYRGRHAHF